MFYSSLIARFFPSSWPSTKALNNPHHSVVLQLLPYKTLENVGRFIVVYMRIRRRNKCISSIRLSAEQYLPRDTDVSKKFKRRIRSHGTRNDSVSRFFVSDYCYTNSRSLLPLLFIADSGAYPRFFGAVIIIIVCAYVYTYIDSVRKFKLTFVEVRFVRVVVARHPSVEEATNNTKLTLHAVGVLL